MEIRPIFSTLMRNKVGPLLIGLQVALTLAIVVNALYIINDRLDRIGRPSGLAESDIFQISSLWFTPGTNYRNVVEEDLRFIRTIPGVKNVINSNTLPMSNGGWSTGIKASSDPKGQSAGSAIYFGDENSLDTYGAKLIAGRNFTQADVNWLEPNKELFPQNVLITAALAKRVFPDLTPEAVVGKRVYFGEDAADTGALVIGVVEKLQAPWVGWDEMVESSTIVPFRQDFGKSAYFVVRTEPGERDAVMKIIEQRLAEHDPTRIIRNLKSLETIRADGYAGDNAMAKTLIAIISALLTITGLGIIGMASFWVTQRTKQIGTRRALGATRSNIVRYFLVENFLITGLGLAAGCVLAFGLNIWLVKSLEVATLPWHYVPIGAAVMWVLGQLAALGPATRASRVSPAVATRSV